MKRITWTRRIADPKPLRAAVVAATALLAGVLHAAEIETPRLTDPRLEITLLAAEPQIVTPIGIAIDEQGRIFVVESHTHHTPDDYPGPESDRVKVFTVNPDGSLESVQVFATGFQDAMNLAFSPDGELYLVHRNGVIILRDTNGDGVCDEQQEIVRMETPGTYPHNGLSGITFGADGWLYLGTGENLGEPYTLHGSDGSTWSGTGGDGANVFRCRPDGSRIELVARGAWNLFGLEFDQAGNLFAVDNDPDGRPPCRLLHIVPGADFGYKYRFGRHGQHPFQAWDGELPGTLPMAAATGEAPCGIWWLGKANLPDGYQDALLVASWGDHFLEVYRPEPNGASFRAQTEIFAEGDQWFRPVGIATAPDGVIYVTDWVDRSYPVHGKGRIWRIAAKPGVETVAPQQAPVKPSPNAEQQRMEQLLAADAPSQLDELLEGLTDPDPFLRSAAIHSLARPVFRAHVLETLDSHDPQRRLGTLLALRRATEDWAGTQGAMLRGPAAEEEEAALRRLLSDPDEDVRYAALAWIGEACLTSLADDIDTAFETGPPSAHVFRAYVAATELLADPEAALEGRPASPAAMAASRAEVVERLLADESKPAALRAMALVMLDDQQQQKLEPLVDSLLDDPDELLRLEAVRTLAHATGESTLVSLKTLARDTRQSATVRAEAVLSLARRGAANALVDLLDDHHPAVQAEAERALLPVEQREPAERPATHDQWRQALEANGDAKSGRRVFFNAATNCAACHQVNGRGGTVGPDLSNIARAADREKLITSILDPSRDIAPMYAQHIVHTTDGRTISGVWVNKRPGALLLDVPDEGVVTIPTDSIESHTVSSESIMPSGSEATMTVQDFRDLLAFLLSLPSI